MGIFVKSDKMKTKDQDWRKIAFAFYALAHNDQDEFDKLEERLKNTEVGKMCSAYIVSKDSQLLDKAGYLLTGTKQWYIYLGRIM